MSAALEPSDRRVKPSVPVAPMPSPSADRDRRPAKLLPRLAGCLFVVFLLAATAEAAPPSDGFNQETSMPVDAASFETYEALQKRVEALEKQLPLPELKPEAEPGYFELSREKWKINSGGHVQLDYITWSDADPAVDGSENYFNYRRLRLVADGTGYGQFDFRLQMTLEPGDGAVDSRSASPDVKDAYLSMNEIPGVGRIRIGNFFVPFSLEQVTNDTNNVFVERSIPTQGIFAADREVGIAVYNATTNRNVTWCGGLFFDSLSDTLKTRIDDNQGYRICGRLTWLPCYDEASNGRFLIHTGAGILHTDDHDNIVRFRARPQVHRGPLLIDTGGLTADSFTTVNTELAVVRGPVALQAEAFVSRVQMLSGEPVHAGGGYSHVSWFLTGENRIYQKFGQHGAQFGRNVPNTNFFLRPGCHGRGAWEVKARCSYLDLADADAGRYFDVTSGCNWYWSDRTRIMFDWIHPRTTAKTTFGDTSSDLLAMRFDFNW